VGRLEDEALAERQSSQEPEIAEIVVGPTPERSEHRQIPDLELVEGIFHRLVEIGPILVGSINDGIFAEPGTGLGADGIEIAYHCSRPEAETREVIGAAVGS